MWHSVWSQMAKRFFGLRKNGLNTVAWMPVLHLGSMVGVVWCCGAFCATQWHVLGTYEQSQTQSSKWTSSKPQVTWDSTVTQNTIMVRKISGPYFSGRLLFLGVTESSCSWEDFSFFFTVFGNSIWTGMLFMPKASYFWWKYFGNWMTILLCTQEGACLCPVDSPCFIDVVVLSFSAMALCKFCGYMKASVFSWLFNVASRCTVKGPAVVVVNLWIHLFCYLQAWMATLSAVWSGLCSYSVLTLLLP